MCVCVCVYKYERKKMCVCIRKRESVCERESQPFFGLAVVLILATSDPAPGSLTPTQATKSPEMLGARNDFFSSCDPNLARAGTAISVSVCECVCVSVCV